MVQVALFITSILSLLFVLVVYMNDTKSTLFRLYSLLGMAVSLLNVVNAIVVSGPVQMSLDSRFQFSRLITPLALATSLTFYLFARQYTRGKLGGAVFIVIPSVLVSAFSFTDYNVFLSPSTGITLGQLYPFYLSVLLFNIVFIFYALYSIRVTGKDAKMQLQYLRYGAISSVVPMLFFGAILPLFTGGDISSIGPLFAVFFLLFAGIAIVKHHLFDIKFAAVRSTAYIMSILLLAVIYFLLAYVVSAILLGGKMTSDVSLSPVNIMLALVLALVFQPIKLFFDKITDDIFYRKNYRSDDFFAKLSQLLASTTDLRGLLERAGTKMAQTFKAEQAFFFINYTNNRQHHLSAGTHGHAKLPVYDAEMLREYVLKSREKIFLTDFVDDKYIQIRRMLLSHRIAVVMPLLQEDNIFGYVMLGDHLSGNYTIRDLKVLTAISNELVIAIQNALSLHEVRELNATLQQRIEVATRELRSSNNQLKHLDETKDEFISMASHQLRTPLTSVKGYISMVLEGDAGNVNARQQQLLVEAFKSSERMVRLIADFLTVSRLQTGKFIIEKTPFDIASVVKQEVRNLELIAKSHDMKLKFKVEKGAMPVVADEQKIRQVIMNLIDNAIYYSHPKSTIVVNLERIKNDVAFTVVDTGIGVPEEEQHRLFTKFYRAPNARKARPDGTGVGLYLARRIIKEHDGTIIFSSREGRGSTFGFRIPLSKAPVAAARPAPETVELVVK